MLESRLAPSGLGGSLDNSWASNPVTRAPASYASLPVLTSVVSVTTG